MATLTPTRISAAGLADFTASLSAADVLGDQVSAANRLLVVMENGDAGSHTLTIAKPAASVNCSGYGDLTVDDLTLTVASGNVGFLTIPGKYADGANFEWTYDDVTSVNIGVFTLVP